MDWEQTETVGKLEATRPEQEGRDTLLSEAPL